MDTVCPETSHFDEDIETFMRQVCFVTCIVGIVVNSIWNRAVTVDFFKGNFPLVMALNACKGYHWIQGTFKALLTGIVLGLWQLLATIFQEIFRHFFIC